ncbi:MAG: dTDP-4-dehydrorhamnose 3,5-epimerase [Desulfobulbaceae bacterium BRH_c16a]|nr:MAG: dTDP-4-dehydrorhamnose 3,5-epimerase [Desulfobulbaceae bacterium BRH_c16a]
MNIQVQNTDLEGVVLIEPEYFQDHRGFFFESYHKKRLSEHGFDLDFVQDNHSRSSRGVLRGFHCQDKTAPQYRMVRCTVGEVWDAVVDLRLGSPTFGKWYGALLTAENKKQILMAPQFAHGFVVLSEVAEIQYKCSGHHNPSAEKTLAWDDPDVNVSWPVKDPILSDRDRTSGMSLKAYRNNPFF